MSEKRWAERHPEETLPAPTQTVFALFRPVVYDLILAAPFGFVATYSGPSPEAARVGNAFVLLAAAELVALLIKVRIRMSLTSGPPDDPDELAGAAPPS